jgi:hypothetical protein
MTRRQGMRLPNNTLKVSRYWCGILTAFVILLCAALSISWRYETASVQALRFATALREGNDAAVVAGPQNVDRIMLDSRFQNASAIVANASLRDVFCGRRYVSVHLPRGERMEDYDWHLVYRVTATRATLVLAIH